MGRISAESENKTLKVDVDLQTDRFWIRHENGDDAQVRLEPDKRVYLCYTTNNRRSIVYRQIPWDDFIVKFREMVDAL